MRSWLYAILLVPLAACTTIPEQLQGTYADVSPARVEPAVLGSTVRWGGVIIDATNAPDSTCFEVLSRDLDRYLRPVPEDRTTGRFIACRNGFYDPEVFAPGREVTLTGRIRDIEVRNIEQFEYRYPVLDVDQLVLWEVREKIVVVDHRYGPFGYPYYWDYPYWGPYWSPYWSRHYPYYRPGWPLHEHSYVRTRRSPPDPADVSDER